MNQTQAIKELKGMFNSTKVINGFIIRRRCWDKNTWQIVDSEDFKTANVLEDFYYQKDLAKRITLPKELAIFHGKLPSIKNGNL